MLAKYSGDRYHGPLYGMLTYDVVSVFVNKILKTINLRCFVIFSPDTLI